MEEEYFFYYLTHGSEHYAKKSWDDDTCDKEHTREKIIRNDISLEKDPSRVDNREKYGNSRGLESHQTQRTASSFRASTGPTSLDSSSDSYDERESMGPNTKTSTPLLLLPPMNGKANYSKMKNYHSVYKPTHDESSQLLGHGPTLLERGDSFFKPLMKRSSSIYVPLSRRASSFVEPFNDHKGKPKSVVQGLFNLTVVGTILGAVMPQNEELPTPWYRYCSSIVGYCYFIFWCASFYPQVVMNFQRKSTEGLSIDYSVVNLFGYICYTTYTFMLYWNKAVREMYIEHYVNANPDGPPPEITVESNDVAFAIHALVMSIIWLVQLQIYDGFKKCREEGKRIVSKPMTVLIFFLLGSCSAYAGLIACTHLFPNLILVDWLNWLDYLYYVAYMKVVVTTAKYIPQVILNMKRKSCVGWNIWNILLDISGGIFSLAQLVGDAIDLNDLSSIMGNSAKLGLSAVSIFFDVSIITKMIQLTFFLLNLKIKY